MKFKAVLIAATALLAQSALCFPSVWENYAEKTPNQWQGQMDRIDLPTLQQLQQLQLQQGLLPSGGGPEGVFPPQCPCPTCQGTQNQWEAQGPAPGAYPEWQQNYVRDVPHGILPRPAGTEYHSSRQIQPDNAPQSTINIGQPFVPNSVQYLNEGPQILPPPECGCAPGAPQPGCGCQSQIPSAVGNEYPGQGFVENIIENPPVNVEAPSVSNHYLPGVVEPGRWEENQQVGPDVPVGVEAPTGRWEENQHVGPDVPVGVEAPTGRWEENQQVGPDFPVGVEAPTGRWEENQQVGPDVPVGVEAPTGRWEENQQVEHDAPTGVEAPWVLGSKNIHERNGEHEQHQQCACGANQISWS